VLSLPILFTAGMSAFDTCDGLLMTRAYAWSQNDPLRRLYYNITTTGMAVAVAAFVASVYLADLAGAIWLAPYARLADHFELVGYAVAALFVLTWASAALVWRACGFGFRADDANVRRS
jgi:high-affinity nickel-transport protein